MLKEILVFLRLIFRYRLDELFVDLFGKRMLISLLRPVSFCLFARKVGKDEARGVRLRNFFIEMGVYHVKLGQALSARKDFIPLDICDELALLRDTCPSFPGEQSVQLIESQLKGSIDQLFGSFDITPIAAASIAQVHAATLKDGSEVVVKVVRPDIDQRIQRSLRSMFAIVRFLDLFFGRQLKSLRLFEVVSEFAEVIENEKNMLREGANANHMRENFSDDRTMYVPKIIWSHTSERVLVMERIYGIPIHEVDQLRKANLDLKKIAENGVKIFFKQLFDHNLFHADMHPGNVFIDHQGVYIAVDYGIVGSLLDEDKMYIAENLLAFLRRDYRRVAQLHIQSRWVNSDTRVTNLEAAIRSVSEPIYGKSLGEISFADYLLRLLKVAREFGMTVQPQIILLQKTLFNIEALGRELYPNLDMWTTAKPFLETWVKKQLSPKKIILDLRQQLPYWQLQMPKILEQLSHQNPRNVRRGCAENVESKFQPGKRKNRFLLGCVCLIAAVLFYVYPYSWSDVAPVESVFLLLMSVFYLSRSVVS